MPSSASLKKLSEKSKLQVEQSRQVQRSQKLWLVALIWLVRIAVGATFVVSGVSKAIDPWGTLYKIEDYLLVWGWEIPRGLIVAGAFSLSMAEAIPGLMLMLGCYRRSAVWVLTTIMAFMTPLTLYIYIYNPVPDCGCFGDFLILSNAATFWKNVVLLAALIFLIKYNRRVMSLISPYLQWIAAVAALAFVLMVNTIGFSVQPLVDFRSYPVGTLLAEDTEDGDEDDTVMPDFRFIYEKDGEKREFTADQLPDSTWTFVDRYEVGEGAGTEQDGLVVYDDGEDVTSDAIASEGEQLLVLIPDMEYADPNFTYYLNELDRYLTARGGSVAGIIATDGEGLDLWRDIAAAEYPLYTAEPTQIKELARGNVALVYLRDGKIVWKRSASSIDGDEMLDQLKTDSLDYLAFNGPRSFRYLLWELVIVLLVIIFANTIGRIILRTVRRNRHQKQSLDDIDRDTDDNSTNQI